MKRYLLASAAVVALSGSVFADTLTGTGTMTAFPSGFGAATQTWISNAQYTSVAPTPFWNNPSDDTFGTGTVAVQHEANIGYLLTDSGGFATSSVGSVIGSDTVASDYVAGTNGVTDPSFSFVRNAVAENIALLFASGGEDGLNGETLTLGYYVGGTNTVLYNSVTNTTTPGALTSFNPSGNYGLYAIVCYAASSCETYYSGQANTGSYSVGNVNATSPGVTGNAWNHFALFQLASGNYVIGFTGQNGYYGENYGDFQDAVIEISAIPEPATIAFMGLGLAALGLLGRGRSAKK